MKIGIEFISSIQIVGQTAAYTGGTNYVIKVLSLLQKEKNTRNFDVVVFFPDGYKAISSDAQKIDTNGTEVRYASDVTECDCNDLDVFFAPQVNGSTLKKLPIIKQKYQQIKLYATLHDRQHNFYKYDWYDRFYYSGIRRTGFVSWAEYYAKKLVFAVVYRKCIGSIDKVFTVSNYSMQELMGSRVKEIKYFVQASILDDYIYSGGTRGDYVLMVGAGRPEKNLLRTLEAFCKYKSETDSALKMKVTGVEESTRENILKKSGLNLDIIKNCVVFLPYLSYEELSKTYANCRYVVFTSKGEGYGLPVREAMSYGKTVLASRTTSIPEVTGASVCYVDPFNVESICEGFKKLDNDKILDIYEGYVAERSALIKNVSKQDSKILMDEILEEFR